MTLELARHLVERGLVDAAQMDDVLQRQVLFGGALDTNLLEAELLDEARLMSALAEVTGLPQATPELIGQRDARIPKLFPARLARKYQTVPITMSGRSLLVLARGRLDPLWVDEINFMLSLSVRIHVVCEARLQVMLRDWLGQEIEPRFAVLAERLGPFPGLPHAAAEAALPAEAGSGSTADLEPAPEILAAREALAGREEPSAPPPVAEPLAAPPARVALALDSLAAREAVERARLEQVRSGRLSLPEAAQACLQAEDRDAIVDVILRFSRQYMEFVGLFVVHEDSLYGWDAVGSLDARERIRRMRLPAQAPSVLRTVLQSQASFLGPLPASGNNQELLQALGRSRPLNVLVAPIHVHGRVVALLYGDAGLRSVRGQRLSDLLVFLSRLSEAFERLILRRKSLKPGSVPDPRRASRDALPRATPRVEPPAAPVEPPAAPVEPPAAPVEPPAAPVEPPAAGSTPILQGGDLTAMLTDTPGPGPEAAPERVEPPPDETDFSGLDQVAPPVAPGTASEAVFDAPPASPAADSGPFGQAPRPPGAGLEEAMREEGEPLVVDAGFLDDQEPPPAVPAAALDVPAALREERVRIEELEAEAPETIVAVDTEQDQDVVVVDTERSFIPGDPDPAAPVSAAATGRFPAVLPAVTPLELEEALAAEPDRRSDARAARTVDLARMQELATRLVMSSAAEAALARAELAELGPAALPVLMPLFPGRLRFDVRGAHDRVPPLSEHGELLACLIDMGPEACQAVAEKLEAPDPIQRYYAVAFLGVVPCARAVGRLAGRLYDRDARVRLTAIEVLHAYRRTPGYEAMIRGLRAGLRSTEPDQQAIAAALLGNFRDVDSLPDLVMLLGSSSRMVSRAAQESLAYITKQDLGGSERKWLKWWKAHKGESRVRWLIEGLRSKNRDIRFSASQELQKLTQEFFGYYFDSDRADRERAIRAWEQWWEEKGKHMRFDG
jgi:hypothetical protein